MTNRVAELLKMCMLKEKAKRRVGELSHGDQRTIEILMTLALRPRLLLLDEPTAGKDEQETDRIAHRRTAPEARDSRAR